MKESTMRKIYSIATPAMNDFITLIRMAFPSRLIPDAMSGSSART